jgi:hypothetical protein
MLGIKRVIPGKLLNGAQPGRINTCASTAMKHQLWKTAILALSVMPAIIGCGKDPKRVAVSTNAPTGSVDKLKEQTRNAVTTSKGFITQQKDRWRKSYSDKLSKFDKQLADLKAKSSAAGDKATSDWHKALAQLEQKKDSAAQKLEQFKTAGADKWQELKTNTETAFADLEKSFKDTFSRFTNDDKPAKQ